MVNQNEFDAYRAAALNFLPRMRMLYSLPPMNAAELAIAQDAWADMLLSWHKSERIPADRLHDALRAFVKFQATRDGDEVRKQHPPTPADLMRHWRVIQRIEQRDVERSKPCPECGGKKIVEFYNPVLQENQQMDCPNCTRQNSV